MQKRLDAVTIGLNAMGAACIALTTFPPSPAATLIGAAQMFGMAGGAAGPSCRRSSSRCY